MKFSWVRHPVVVVLFTALAVTSYFLIETGSLKMKTQKAYTLKEPLLIEGETQKTYSLLPTGAVLYHDKSWAEGHDTYHVYFHFKGKLEAEPANPDIVAPLWLRSVERSEVSKLVGDYPITKDELVKILKAKKMTREELAEIVREWRE